MPKNKVLVSYATTAGIWGLFLTILLGLFSITSANIMGARIENGYYSLLMMKGGERVYYALSLYLTDVICHLLLISLM